MQKTLIIAEKPSVAKDIASALGVPRQGDVYENSDLVISNCIGHLVEIYAPEAETPGAALPIIPEVFSLRPIEKTASQFKTLKQLMSRADVSCVVNACDAGREGEAIFRLVYEHAKCRKPIERMWLQSMTKNGIKSAWETRQPGEKYTPLADAAKSRGEADFLVGVNGSRACRQAIGRVMTPTLALVVDRFLANRDFKPVEYFEVIATIGLGSGDYKAKWVPPGAGEKQIFDRQIADSIVQKCKGIPPTSIVDESKPTKEAPPFLFDLTSLQREANKKLKFSAQKTLTIAQALYEKHKVTSYPRTDSQRLPEDYVSKCGEILVALDQIQAFSGLAKRPVQQGWVKPNKRIFDDAKISDHFAIIPTGIMPEGLSGDEQKIFELVARRFVAIFYPDAEYTSTVRTSVIATETFRATGRVLVTKGWLEVVGSPDTGDKTPALPILRAGEQGENKKIEVLRQETKPPALYTEATLLTAMETAGKALDDEELADAMKERGLGTPATRAATIEKLLAPGKQGAYMERSGNHLVPTDRGLSIIDHLKTAAPKMVSPILTGEWEQMLLQMEKGKYSRQTFMQLISDFVRELVVTVAANASAIGGQAPSSIQSPCPKCGKPLIFDGRVVRHENEPDCPFKLWGMVSGRKMAVAELEQLIVERELPVLSGFKSKEKKPFEAGLRLNADMTGLEFVFSKEVETKLPCPKCKSRLKSNGRKVTCQCGFFIWTEVAGVKLTDAQITDLLTAGKTAVIKGFKSKAGRKFDAALTFSQDKGEISFDFSGVETNKGRHKDGEKCPKCKTGKLVNKRTKENKPFLGCSKHPECKFFEWH